MATPIQQLRLPVGHARLPDGSTFVDWETDHWAQGDTRGWQLHLTTPDGTIMHTIAPGRATIVPPVPPRTYHLAKIHTGSLPDGLPARFRLTAEPADPFLIDIHGWPTLDLGWWTAKPFDTSSWILQEHTT